MEIRVLRAFLAVADHASVTAAARELHVTQPALSRQIQALERSLGLRLFDRRDRLALTSAGRELAGIARDLVVRSDLADKAVDAIRAGALPAVTISSPATTLADVVAPFIATWGSEDPMPGVRAEAPAAVYPSLAAGADLAIGTEPPPSTLDAHAVAVLPVWAYVAAAHPWAGRDEVPLAEVAQQPLLLLGREQHARQALDSALTGAGLAPATVTEFATPVVAQAVAAAGRGVAVLSDDARFELAPVAITYDGRRLVVRLWAAWAPEHHAARALSALAVRLSDFCLQRYGVDSSERLGS